MQGLEIEVEVEGSLLKYVTKAEYRIQRGSLPFPSPPEIVSTHHYSIRAPSGKILREACLNHKCQMKGR